MVMKHLPTRLAHMLVMLLVVIMRDSASAMGFAGQTSSCREGPVRIEVGTVLNARNTVKTVSPDLG